MARGGRVIYKRAAPGRKRSRRSKASDDDDDDDEEYILEEEEEAEDDESSDEPLASDGEEEEEYEFGESTSGSDDEEPAADELDEDDDEEFLAPRSKRRRAPSKPKRKVIKKSRVFDDDYDYDYNDDDEEEEDEDVSVQNKGRRRNKAAARPHRQKSRDSDYEEYEREEGDDDEDEDFSPDEHDLDEEGFLTSGLKRRGGDLKHGGNKRKPRVLRQKKGKKRRRNRSEDDFIVKDHVAGDGKKKETKKLRRKKSSTSMTIKKKSPVESDTSDFEFITSDDDFVEDTIMLDGRGSKNKNAGKTNARGARRRNVVLSDESESSSDGDYMISEEELRDLGVGGILDQPQPKRIIAGRKDDEKGKEKENVDFGKPLCGICLSEEQRTTVRGVLNCCAHYFCFACIMEWSKVESRCPICKRRFGTITKSSRSDPGFGLRKAVIKVEKRDQVYQPSEEEIRRMLDPYENVVCIECHQGGDDSLMLLCDICDSPAHTYCVGLGREVPEGNWYCECCRSAADGSSYLHNQGIVTDQAASSSDFLASRIETEDVAVRDNTNSQRSSQPSLQDIDLNVSPRSAEDYGSMSQPFGAGASTLSGRRAIHQRIRILLSNNRPRQIFAETDVSHGNIRSDVMTSDVRRSGENLHSSQGLSWNMASSTEQCQQSNRPSLQSSANLVQCTTAGSSFRQVDGAKEQVMSMVKRHVKELCSDSPLDHATLKEIIRRATNTILAACGIKHNRRMVSAPVHPPSSCSHNLEQERIILTQGCCFLCFSSYIKDVVQKILHAT